MRRFFLFVLLFISSVTYGAVRTSVNSGWFASVNTWDCNCVPGANDDIVVNHNIYQYWNNFVGLKSMTISSNGYFTSYRGMSISEAVTIENGGELITREQFDVGGDYINHGRHDARDYLVLFGNATTVEITGDIQLENWIVVYENAKFVTPNTSVDITTGYGLYLYDPSAVLYNKGKIGLNYVGGVGSSNWINQAGAELTLHTGFYGALRLNAMANNNHVIYDGGDQDVFQPMNRRYHHLTVKGDDVSEVKELQSRLIIRGDLEISNTTLDVNGNDIDIKGDWYNTDGIFDPGNEKVTFSGNAQLISHNNGPETFNELELTSSASTSSLTAVKVSSNLVIATNFFAQGNDVEVQESWVNNGNFVHGDNTVTLSGAQAAFVTGSNEFYNLVVNKTASTNNMGSIAIRKELKLDNGLLQTNDDLTILSDENGTARIAKVVNGNISGDITVQRYLETTHHDWHLLSSPIQNATLEDWNDDIMTMGFPGSNFPNFYFNNCTYYDETFTGHKDNGLLNANDVNDEITNTQAWRVYLPAGVRTIDVTGAVYVGDLDLDLSYTNSDSILHDGWNLIANPYASTIDWDEGTGWVKNGIRDAIYIWNPLNSQYTTYVSGAGTNGGSQYVPSSQAIWVQANQNNPSIQIKEDAKSAVDAAFKNAVVHNDLFQVKLIAPNGFADEVVIRTHQDATHEYDDMLDALDLRSPMDYVPSLGVKGQDDTHYSVYSFAWADQEEYISLPVTTNESGAFTFSFQNIDQFTNATCLIFEDMTTGESYPISENVEVMIDLETGEYPARFRVRVCPPIDSFDGMEEMTDKTLSSSHIALTDQAIVVSQLPDHWMHAQVMVHDVLGKKLWDGYQGTKGGVVYIPTHALKGTCFVTLIGDQGEKISHKVQL